MATPTFGYQRRLKRDIGRWRAQGWVTPEGERAILADASGRGVALAPALAMLGAVLIAFAAMSFVAANWQDIPKFVRLGLLTAGLWGAYGASGAFFKRGHDAIGHAALLLGCGLFGANIMLIAQMYHMEGNPPDAVLTWCLGTLLAGVLMRSTPALALAMALVVLWSGWESSLVRGVHWPFLLGWAAVTGGFVLARWRYGVHLSAITLAGFVVTLGFQLGDGHNHWIGLLFGIAAAAAGWAAAQQWPLFHDETTTVMGYGLATVFAALFIFQFVEPSTVGSLIPLAVLSLALSLAAIAWGTRSGNPDLLRLGYAGFAVEVLSIYFRTIGSLLGSSVFFLLTGIVVIVLAWLAWKLHARTQGMTSTVEGEAR